MASTSAPLRDFKRLIDIELTNRCNARCSFCPRDATPDQGFMREETFYRTIERVKELDLLPEVNSAGQGDPLLHPQVLEFARHLQRESIPYGITTNASRLAPSVAEALHDAMLWKINFSVSDLGADYAEVYALDFDTTLANIRHFLRLNEQRSDPCRVVLNMVVHDINRDKLETHKQFWREQGIREFLVFKQINRGGACHHGGLFLNSDRYRREAGWILASEQVTTLCTAAFLNLFVGWNGNYYICCNDYEKTTPLGNVFEHSIYEMDEVKRARLLSSQSVRACLQCDIDPVNRVREKLLEIERGQAHKDDLVAVVADLKSRTELLPAWLQPQPAAGGLEPAP